MTDRYYCGIHDFGTDSRGQMHQHIDLDHPGGAAKDSPEEFDTYRKCPRCDSGDIYAERAHGDTICRDCGWYTEQGSPREAVDWRAIHEEGGDAR